MEVIDPNMNVESFFQAPTQTMQKQYECLRAFFVEKLPAADIAKLFGYKTSAVYSMIRDFKARHQAGTAYEYFFQAPSKGRNPKQTTDDCREIIVLLRKKYLSVPDIKTILDAQGTPLSERHIYNLLRSEGFARLPRRDNQFKQTALSNVPIQAEKSTLLELETEEFNSQELGILLFLPYLKSYGIDKIIEQSNYPETKQLPRLNSILAFVGLKLLNVRRYTADDLWCMDRGAGLFAGLNVLPKAGWFTSYSSRITGKMNLDFLQRMHQCWCDHGMLSDTANLDFVSIPYWGEDTHLENNWSGTRHHALQSILAAIAHDPDTGIITYGDTKVRHKNESNVAVEFLDFYKQSSGQSLKYLVFDSKFTTYENLRKLDENDVKFITIRRRGKNIVDELDALPKSEWKPTRVPMAHGKTRMLNVNEQTVQIKKYGKEIRQIAITGHGKIKPALIITNDFEISQAEIIRKYAKRWLVEKTISEQTHFFHLNRLSSSMVIKVDFDLTISILAYNLYRLLAKDLPGYENCCAQTIYEKFIVNEGVVSCDSKQIIVKLKKKRRLPMLLEAMETQLPLDIDWLNNRKLLLEGATTS